MAECVEDGMAMGEERTSATVPSGLNLKWKSVPASCSSPS